MLSNRSKRDFGCRDRIRNKNEDQGSSVIRGQSERGWDFKWWVIWYKSTKASLWFSQSDSGFVWLLGHARWTRSDSWEKGKKRAFYLQTKKMKHRATPALPLYAIATKVYVRVRARAWQRESEYPENNLIIKSEMKFFFFLFNWNWENEEKASLKVFYLFKLGRNIIQDGNIWT